MCGFLKNVHNMKNIFIQCIRKKVLRRVILLKSRKGIAVLHNGTLAARSLLCRYTVGFIDRQ